jgi:hypothetical protein
MAGGVWEVQVERVEGVTYKCKRLPAWCDRILYHSNMPPAWQPTCVRYTSVEEVASSDHKPVIAVFDVPSFSSPAQVVTDVLDSAHPSPPSPHDPLSLQSVFLGERNVESGLFAENTSHFMQQENRSEMALLKSQGSNQGE